MKARVAIVGRDTDLRLQAARAFDSAPVDWTVRLFENIPSDADAVVVCPDVDAPGIPFDPDRPRWVVDEVMKAVSPQVAGRTIGIRGTGGGVGTTSIALHLCAALGKRTSTCYVELDPNRGVRHRLQLPEDGPTWADVGSTDEALLRAALPIEGSFRVLLRPTGTEDLDVASLLDRCTAMFQRVVVDGGSIELPGSLPDGQTLLVMSPSVVGARRARAFLVDHGGSSPVIATNRLGPGSETTRLGLERIVGDRIVVELPCAPGMRDSEDEGRLFVRPWSRWWRRIERIAAALM